MRLLTLVFFSSNNFSFSCQTCLKRISNFLNFQQVICINNRLPCVFITGESRLPGSEYSGASMLVPNTPRSRLPGVFITGESRLPGVFTTGELRLPSVFTTGESRLLGVFITGESFQTPGSCFTDFKDHTAIFKGIIILKINCRLL